MSDEQPEATPTRAPVDAGVSLVELLVAMSLASLLLLCLGSVFTAELRGSTQVRDKTTANAEVRLAADVVGRRLRVATPSSTTTPAFLTMTATEVSFTASLQSSTYLAVPAQAAQDPPLTVVTYRYDAGRACLTETLTPASGTAKTTCLLRGTAAGQTVFTYYAGATGSALATQPADVRSVGVAVTSTATSSGRTATSAVTTRVTCPNTVPRA